MKFFNDLSIAAKLRGLTVALAGGLAVVRSVARPLEEAAKKLEQDTLLQRQVCERTAQLQESENHMHHMISTVPALVAYVDAEQRYVYVNDQYRKFFAPQRNDIRGCSVWDIL
jgi:PAS domain-containing protein